MLVKPRDIFGKAFNMQYAIGAFNVLNLEFVQAIVAAAEDEESPVILQINDSIIENVGLEEITAIMKVVAAKTSVPVVMHLDNSNDAKNVRKCIENGFMSVTINEKEDIDMIKEMVSYAHDRGVWVETKIDVVNNEVNRIHEFVQGTKIDALAVSIGTTQGAFTGCEFVQFEALEKIEKELPDLPLVLRNVAGIDNQHLQKIATTNVCKICIDIELQKSFNQAIQGYCKTDNQLINSQQFMKYIREAIKVTAKEKIALLGSNNQII